MFSYKTILIAISLSAHLAAAAPFGGIERREVPQEHSHEAILIDMRKQLAISNPQNLGDPVFGLLGAAAAAGGLGSTTDADCLQQATADQAFTNAKAANDVAGMTSALIYRALERNSGSVGGASPNCTSVTAVNPEIAALAQHQDPAGSGAQAFNKNLVLELAKQIASIGGTPTDALKSGTFAPGTIGDPTAKGNTCDDANDTAGCIVSQNLLVPDATEDEINAAVAGTSVSTGSASNTTTSAAASATTDASDCPTTATVTVTVGATATASTTTAAAAAATTTAAATSSNADIGNFGSCSVPQIEFGAGFDNRKETSFQPVDKTSYNHGSAQGIDIITQFICDTLTNSCGADATAKATCATAKTAADGAAAKTGAQADAFNAVFGITTNFVETPEIDDQGNFVAGTGNATALAAGGIGNFGSCTTPQIQFATGFDNRKETSFEPVDQTSYNHGSAQNIDIITQFICDTLTNSCGADAQAKATCATAKAAADTQAAKTGAQADAFNAAFGITTNFAAVAAVDDQGNTIAGSTGSSAAAAATTTAAAAAATTSAAAAATTSAAAAATTSAAAASSTSTAASGSVGSFGSCSTPEITFAAGLDGRKETAFAPADPASFNHGSADNIAVITGFICSQLSSACKADATAVATCATASAAAAAAQAPTGAQADAFNAAFGLSTNFAAVQVINNQGVAQ